MEGLCCGPGYASPSEAIRAPSEKLLYTIAIYTGTGIQKPDYLATVDVDPKSESYSNVIHRLEMPGIGDELHHMGWNACSSCHDDKSMSRRYLLVPSFEYFFDTTPGTSIVSLLLSISRLCFDRLVICVKFRVPF